jgi:hypothetical protein
LSDPLRGAIAILGWGSLIWDLDDLAPHVAPTWRMAEGPQLPMEFSRVSPKRMRSLVVALDPEDGVDCATSAIASVRRDINEAAEDLRRRERARDIAQIGALSLDTGFVRSAMPEVAERVGAWCSATGARGAVWTDLSRNFHVETGAPFSLDAGMAYLRGLGAESLLEATRYIDSAPRATDTPMRRRLEEDPWWRALPRPA